MSGLPQCLRPFPFFAGLTTIHYAPHGDGYWSASVTSGAQVIRPSAPSSSTRLPFWIWYSFNQRSLRQPRQFVIIQAKNATLNRLEGPEQDYMRGFNVGVVYFSLAAPGRVLLTEPAGPYMAITSCFLVAGLHSGSPFHQHSCVSVGRVAAANRIRLLVQ